MINMPDIVDMIEEETRRLKRTIDEDIADMIILKLEIIASKDMNTSNRIIDSIMEVFEDSIGSSDIWMVKIEDNVLDSKVAANEDELDELAAKGYCTIKRLIIKINNYIEGEC